MAEYIVSKGETSTGLDISCDSMFILKGGTAEITKLNDEADMFVSNGGRAIETEINQYGQHIRYFFELVFSMTASSECRVSHVVSAFMRKATHISAGEDSVLQTETTE